MLKINITQQLETFDLCVDVVIPSQGVTAIFGKSGSGKSSLTNLIAGLSQPSTGQIYLNDRVLFDSEKSINIPPEKRKIGYVFQEHRLFPHISVEKNLKYGCKRVDSEKFLQIVTLLGITHLLKRFPNNLSGGEKQRVAIGRALLSDPDILLMDEPLSALDLPRKNELLNYLSELAKQIEIPILYVSHSLDELIRLADFLLLLDNGKVTAFDKTTTVWKSEAFREWQPENQQVSLLELPIISEDTHYKMVALGLGKQKIWLNREQHYQINEKLRITLNSRDVSLTKYKPECTSIRNILQGTICKILPKNNRLDIQVLVENEKIWATISYWAFDEMNLTLGQNIYLQIKALSL